MAEFTQLKKVSYLKSGGYKHVYECEIDNIKEAFKLLALPIAQTDDQKEYRSSEIARIEREIDILNNDICPELVSLGSLKPTTVHLNNIEFLAYTEEFLDGLSVSELSMNSGFPTESELNQLGLSISKAIEALSNINVVHRDIKPLNIMQTNDPHRPFVLLDLGLAYSTDEPGLTINSQAIPGTPEFIAPEMAEPDFRSKIDFRSDIYTLGLTLFIYASKKHPLNAGGENFMATISRVLTKQPIPLKSLRSDLSLEFCSMVDRMVRKKQFLRPNRISELITLFSRT